MVPGSEYVLLFIGVLAVVAALFFDRWHSRHQKLTTEVERLDFARQRLNRLSDIIQVFFTTSKSDAATKEFFEWLKGVGGDQYEEVLAQLKKNPSATAPALRVVTPPKQDGIDAHT